jgi:hypothetical protein
MVVSWGAMAREEEPVEQPADPRTAGVELRPLRPAAARKARQRRATTEPLVRDQVAAPPVASESGPGPDVVVDVLEHLTVLSQVVLSTSERMVEHVDALADRLQSLEAEVRGIAAAVQRMERTGPERSEPDPVAEARLVEAVAQRVLASLPQPTASDPDHVDRLAAAIVERLRTAFRVVDSPGAR